VEALQRAVCGGLVRGAQGVEVLSRGREGGWRRLHQAVVQRWQWRQGGGGREGQRVRLGKDVPPVDQHGKPVAPAGVEAKLACVLQPDKGLSATAAPPLRQQHKHHQRSQRSLHAWCNVWRGAGGAWVSEVGVPYSALSTHMGGNKDCREKQGVRNDFGRREKTVGATLDTCPFRLGVTSCKTYLQAMFHLPFPS